jgi:hypothetical protein
MIFAGKVLKIGIKFVSPTAAAANIIADRAKSPSDNKSFRSDCDAEWMGVALLHKSVEGRTSPIPRQTYPMASVTGMPRAV